MMRLDSDEGVCDAVGLGACTSLAVGVGFVMFLISNSGPLKPKHDLFRSKRKLRSRTGNVAQFNDLEKRPARFPSPACLTRP